MRLLCCLMLVAASSGLRAETFDITVAGARIEVELLQGRLSVDRADLEHWITTASRAITGYYGQFPVARLRIRVVPIEGRSMRGTTWGGRTAFIRILLGAGISGADLENDWRLTHEMVHLAFPQLDSNQDWFEEGLATYVEPIARALDGSYAAEEVWRRFIEGMPFGAEPMARSGLDEGRGWARTYWGGALFCLLADLAIREQSNQRFGLRDALAGIVRAGGSIEGTWTMQEILQTADAAVGTTTMSSLYADLSSNPRRVELDEIWRRLGVELSHGTVSYDETAPQAATRRAIVTAD